MGLVVLFSTALVACGAPAPIIEQPPSPIGLIATLPEKEGKMVYQKVQLTNKQADGYIIPLGSINIVLVVTDVGMVGCGAFDVMAFDAFDYPAVRVKSTSGNPIATIDDLLAGVVKDANAEATKLGINIGISGREALDKL
jgi:uncharacterized protein YunC (DUF1805 family)